MNLANETTSENQSFPSNQSGTQDDRDVGDKSTESTRKENEVHASVDSFLNKVVERCKNNLIAFVDRRNYSVPRSIGELPKRIGSDLRSFKTSYSFVGINVMQLDFG